MLNTIFFATVEDESGNTLKVRVVVHDLVPDQERMALRGSVVEYEDRDANGDLRWMFMPRTLSGMVGAAAVREAIIYYLLKNKVSIGDRVDIGSLKVFRYNRMFNFAPKETAAIDAESAARLRLKGRVADLCGDYQYTLNSSDKEKFSSWFNALIKIFDE